MIDDLVTWLRAQLDEDERVAKELAKLRPKWSVGGGYPETGPTRVIGVDDYVIVEDDTDWAAEIVTHIARHDPARVLREVEAKRRSLDELLRLPHYAWDGREEYGCPKATDVEIWRQIFEGDQVCNCGRDEHVDRSLRLLTLPYTGRPGYLEAWRP